MHIAKFHRNTKDGIKLSVRLGMNPVQLKSCEAMKNFRSSFLTLMVVFQMQIIFY